MGVSEAIDTSAIKRELRDLNSAVTTVNNNIIKVKNSMDQQSKDLAELKKQFEAMMNEGRKSANIQRAATELVAVRQELEKKFGNYGIVRNTMIGILQATDSALVRKVTISNVSEELMVSTPNYWLAPVLVALAAWIGNNRDLADRAIREAIRRDNEHTSLVMALICRRNNRTQTSYQWLARYFATQNGASFDEDEMVYIDAYINGIFGPDEKHMCDSYISRWIDEIRGADAGFEDKQTESWQDYFNSFNVNEAEKYPELHECVKEFGYLKDYASHIDAVPAITKKFNGIKDAFVDQDKLRRDVDAQLLRLVSADDASERQLRSKEEYLQAIKECGGDIEAARTLVNKRMVEKENKTMSIVEQMTHVIRSNDQVRPSEQKTAVSFLHTYINKGFNKYLEKDKKEVPQTFTLNVNGFQATATEATDPKGLYQAYDQYLVQRHSYETGNFQKSLKIPLFMWLSIILGVVGIVLLFILPILGILCLAGAGFSLAKFLSARKKCAEGLQKFQKKYMDLSNTGKQKISKCLKEWGDLRKSVASFESGKPDQITA